VKPKRAFAQREASIAIAVGDPSALMTPPVETLREPPKTAALTGPVEVDPEGTMPALTDVTVHQPAPEAVGDADVARAFDRLRRSAAMIREREPGEPAELGDEIRVSTRGTIGNAVVSETIRDEEWTQLDERLTPPGLGDAIVGMAVGERRRVVVQLPADHESSALAGASVEIDVSLGAATELQLPDPDDVSFLRGTGLGAQRQQVEVQLRHALVERARDASLAIAHRDALRTLAAPAEIRLFTRVIDHELDATWYARERMQLLRAGVEDAAVEQARVDWLSDDGRRAAAEERLRFSVVLQTLALREGVAVDDDGLKAYIDAVADAAEIPGAELRAAVTADPDLQRWLHYKLTHILTLEHVMRSVRVQPGQGAA
jgi:FKBP-type peptidyl-prolyl cis-trans isomerase (trigger factor)